MLADTTILTTVKGAIVQLHQVAVLFTSGGFLHLINANSPLRIELAVSVLIRRWHRELKKRRVIHGVLLDA